MVTVFFLLFLLSAATRGASVSPTCGTACVYESAAEFAYNCEETLFMNGNAYSFVGFKVSCSDTDKGCPMGISACSAYDGAALCKTPSRDVLLTSFVCRTPTGLTVKTGTKETTRTGEFWYFYTFTLIPTVDEKPSSAPVAGWVILGLAIGAVLGVGLTCAGVWIRQRRAGAAFQR